MRILLTSILVRTGILTHVWDLAKHLQAAGIKVNVALFVANKELSGSAWESYYNSLLGPIKNVPFCFYHNINQLREFTQRQKVHLIHAHSSWSYKSAYAVCQLLSLPLVLTLHGVENWSPYRDTLTYAKQIIAIGKAQAEAADVSYLNKISIIDNGIDLNKFQPKVVKLEKNSPLRVIWFGRTGSLSSEGALALDQAIGRLKNSNRRIEAIMVGEIGTIQTKYIKTYGWLENPVPFLQWGQVAFGHGRALREAMACGNIGFLLGHGYAGIIKPGLFARSRHFPVSTIPEYDLPRPTSEAITRDLEELCHNKTLLYQLRLQARKIAEEFFDVREMVAKTIAVYHSV